MTLPNNATFGVLSANSINTSKLSLYDYRTAAGYQDEGSINDVTAMELLEVIEKGILKTLRNRRDDAEAVWEEEDDDASYGEYNALKGAVELVEAFIKNAPNARYSGLKNMERYNPRYSADGRRF